MTDSCHDCQGRRPSWYSGSCGLIRETAPEVMTGPAAQSSSELSPPFLGLSPMSPGRQSQHHTGLASTVLLPRSVQGSPAPGPTGTMPIAQASSMARTRGVGRQGFCLGGPEHPPCRGSGLASSCTTRSGSSCLPRPRLEPASLASRYTLSVPLNAGRWLGSGFCRCLLGGPEGHVVIVLLCGSGEPLGRKAAWTVVPAKSGMGPSSRLHPGQCASSHPAGLPRAGHEPYGRSLMHRSLG